MRRMDIGVYVGTNCVSGLTSTIRFSLHLVSLVWSRIKVRLPVSFEEGIAPYPRLDQGDQIR